MDIGLLLNYAIEILFTIVIPFIGKQIYNYYKNKSMAIKNDNIRSACDYAFEKLSASITRNIEAVEETSKKELLKSIEEGKATKDDLPKLANEVKELVLQQLSENILKDLSYTIEDLDSLIQSKIESQLGQLKINPNSPVSKTNLEEKVKPR